MENVPGITKDMAYDQARKEFYRLRQEEDIERRIAKEEARMVGAYFGKTYLQVGMELEDRSYNAWKDWAGKENDRIDSFQKAASTTFDQETTQIPGDELEKPEEDSASL